MDKKLILAYSGGLDTSCCLKWLKDKGFKVVCFSADLGSEFSPAQLKKKVAKSKGVKLYIKDLKDEFAEKYILPSLKANALYQGKYFLNTALGRPLIAKHLVEVARKEKASFAMRNAQNLNRAGKNIKELVTHLSDCCKAVL